MCVRFDALTVHCGGVSRCVSFPNAFLPVFRFGFGNDSSFLCVC